MKLSRKLYTLIITVPVIAFIYSCNFLNPKDVPQVLPNYDYDSTEQIHLFFESDNIAVKRYLQALGDSDLIRFFKNKKNYFPKDLISHNGVKPKGYITLIGGLDTLDLTIYSTNQKGKLEAGFLDPYDPKDHWKFRKMNRFYISENLMDVIDNMSN